MNAPLSRPTPLSTRAVNWAFNTFTVAGTVVLLWTTIIAIATVVAFN